MRVLLATDGSASAWHAIEEAIRTLPLTTAEVHVVAVASNEAAKDDPACRHQDASQADLDAAIRALAAGGIRARAIMRRGDAAEQILAVATELAPDFIVVGSHGHGPVGRHRLGSVANAVAHRWGGAVIVIRRPTDPASHAPARTVASVMTTAPLCADLYQSVDEVATMMAEGDTGFIPVLRGDRLAGVITDRDIVVRVLATHNDPARVSVCEAATADVIWVTPEMPVEEAVRLMEHHQIRRVVVMDGPRVAGVVSLGDLAETVPDTAEHALVEISKSPKTLAHGRSSDQVSAPPAPE